MKLSQGADGVDTLIQLSSELHYAHALDDIMAFLLDTNVAALAADRKAVFLLKGENLALVAGRSEGADLKSHYSFNNTSVRELLQTREIIVADCEALNDTFRQVDTDDGLFADISTCILVPLSTGDAFVGLLYLGYRNEHTFSEDDKRFLAALAEVAGNALHRAEVLETFEQQVADRTRRLTALYNVTMATSESLEFDRTLTQALDQVLRVMNCTAGAIFLTDEVSGIPELVHQKGFSDDVVQQAFNLPKGQRLADLVIENEQLLVISDILNDERSPAPAKASGYRSYLGAPMRAHGQVCGALSVFGSRERQFSVDDITLIASIADHIGVAIENARLHRKAERLAVAEERQRLARELHDSVTQLLYSLVLFTGTVTDLLETEAYDQMAEICRRVDTISVQALKEMRLLIYELQPASLEETSVKEALSRRLQAVEQQAGVKTNLVVKDSIGLPTHVVQTLISLTQEALNNVLKHARADSVTVRVSAGQERIELDVIDDGVGFDVDTSETGRGVGMKIMKERVEELGGVLTFESSLEAGTTVKVRVHAPYHRMVSIPFL